MTSNKSFPVLVQETADFREIVVKYVYVNKVKNVQRLF